MNEAAFGGADEADLIDRLREEGANLLSLVAELDDQIIGHILFSRMTVDTAQGPLAAVALAPMAVLPAHQVLGWGADWFITDWNDCAIAVSGSSSSLGIRNTTLGSASVRRKQSHSPVLSRPSSSWRLS